MSESTNVFIDHSRSQSIHALGETQQGIKWSIYQGDAYEVLRKFPSNAYNCVITSPPYFWLRDYGVEGQIGQEETIEEYVKNISQVMDEVQRVLKSNGVLFLNIGDTYYSGKGASQGIDKKSGKRRFGLRAVDKSGGMGLGLRQKTMIGIPWRIALEMTQRNWILRSDIIWYRKHSLPESVRDRPRRSYEHIFMFVRDRHYYFDRSPLVNKDQEDMWTITARPASGNDISTAPFPDVLVQRCLAIGCPEGGLVLDPFAGSGTTLRVSAQEKCESTGIDLNAEYCDYISKRMRTL